MIIITNQGNSFKIEGLVPSSYFPDGTLNAPKNSLIAVIEDDVVSFKGATNFNTLFATTLGELTINGVQADSENVVSLLNTTIYKINSGGGGGTGGTEYFAGQNIDISEENVISVVGINVPTKVSQLQNDEGYITSADVHTYSAGTNISIVDDVISVTGITEPTKTSDLTNDSGYITSSDIPSIPAKVSDLQNDEGYITSADVPEYSGSTNINVTDHIISLTGVPTEFKTINGQSITGSGNITIEGGTGVTEYYAGQNIDITDHVISVTGISVPTNVSELTNDEGYITMSDIPSIPTKTSDLQNDNGFITSDALTAYTRTQNFATVNGQSITNGGDVLIPTGPTYTAGQNISLVNNEISVVGIPTEFKTINGQSITGSGNITIEGGTGGTVYTAGQNIDITNNVISVTGITEPTKTSDLTNDSGYITSADVHTYSAGTNISIVDDVISVTGLSIPTSASQLTNDTNYITMVVLTQAEYNQLSAAEKNDPTKLYSISDAPSIGHEYSAGTNISIVDDVISVSGVPTEFKTINNQSITGNGNITIESTEYTAGTNIDITNNVISVTDINVPTKTSDLTNDSGFITSSDIPSKVSDLTNDEGYITSADVHTYSAGTNISIVDDVISVTGLSIPTKTSDLTNDSDFITSADVPEYSGSTNINVDNHVISLTGVPTEFKTINNQSITGSGNITVESTAYSGGTNIDITDHVISVTGINVPTSASQLTNDAGYVSTVLLTQSQYDALSTEEKNDATKLYIITDAASPAFIDDTLVSSGSTYSSQKIETILGDIETALSNI
jgi:hypothetical protein